MSLSEYCLTPSKVATNVSVLLWYGDVMGFATFCVAQSNMHLIWAWDGNSLVWAQLDAAHKQAVMTLSCAF